MATVEETESRAKSLVGSRIEIPVHYDRWMQGARFGVVTGWRKCRDGYSAHVLVKMDHPQVRKRVRVWAIDFDYLKVLA
jgi:hypothetical protein